MSDIIISVDLLRRWPADDVPYLLFWSDAAFCRPRFARFADETPRWEGDHHRPIKAAPGALVHGGTLFQSPGLCLLLGLL